MTNHYEALGVSPTATADDIKKAYRAQAKVKHPDKGGAQSEFEPVVKAYEVLSDPERRQLYDATGQDRRPPIEIEAQNILLQGFNQALASEEDIEIVAFVRTGLERASNHIPSEQEKLKARKKKLTAKRKKITAKGVNVVHLIIDGELKNIDAQLAQLKHQSIVNKACLKALELYDEDWTPPPPPTYRTMDMRRGFYTFDVR